jgi:hypothetical protein
MGAIFNGILKAIESGVAKIKAKAALEWVVQRIGKIEWKQTHAISEEDKLAIHKLLADGYYIILTRRSNHFSTYAISFANFILTRKFSFYSHSLMNLEDEVKSPDDFRLIEAVGKGTQYSSFDTVFGTVDAVALLKPKALSLDEWNDVMDKLKSEIGKPYDTLFDLKSDAAVSCVELVRDALRADPEYATKYAAFEAMINKNRNLTPQMYFDCSDFEVVHTVKR